MRLTMVTALAVAFAAVPVACAQETQAQIAARIAKMRGTADFNATGFVDTIMLARTSDDELITIDFGALSRLRILSIRSREATDRSISHLCKIPPGVEYLRIEGAGISDQVMMNILGGQKGLRSVSLDYTTITDRTLREIGGLECLHRVSVEGTRISDAGLKSLVTMRGLYRLNLARTQITDVGLAELGRIRSLGEIDLEKTEVSDNGILQLRGLTYLRSLKINGTKVTDAGKTELQRALPRLKFR